MPKSEIFPLQWIEKSNDQFYIVEFSVPNWNGVFRAFWAYF